MDSLTQLDLEGCC